MFNKEKNTTPSVYFKSLEIENVRCFKEKQTIDFTDKNGDIAQWTVILGNNNTGKTTLLRCLVDLELEEDKPFSTKKYLSLKVKEKWLDEIDWIYNNKFKVSSKLRVTKTNKDNKKFSEEGTIYIEGDIGIRSYESFNDIHHTTIDELFDLFYVIKYGVLKITEDNLSFIDNSGFIDSEKLINPENWLVKRFVASKLGGLKDGIKQFNKVKSILLNILPDAQDLEIKWKDENAHVEIKTDFGWTRINDLGYGYQTLMAWVVDLAKKMFDRYPDSETPLKEPAIVLVDEIDLHLHPEWQRKIIHWLSSHFPNTQFIVTAHSPLVIQSAENVNVVLLKKEEEKGEVKIEQPDVSNFQGWTVEEILSELMGLDNRIHSDAYLEFMREFDVALDEDNYQKAKTAYDELDKMLHPKSPQRKLLRLQMASLTPLESITV